MVFSSLSFLFLFLPIFLLLDRVVKKELQPLLLIASSILFYMWGEGYGVFILIFLSLFNLALGKILSSTKIYKKFFLFIGVSVNLATLIYYKYLGWLFQEISKLLGIGYIEISVLGKAALPLGISFFVFHAISYLVDIYRGVVTKESVKRGGISFLEYFFMFPHLVAGPIVRFESIRLDLLDRHNNIRDSTLFSYGVIRFIVGINKKVLIANTVAPIADIAFFNTSANISPVDAWLGALAYSIQIYFDFSGYSDMAIGLAAMLGVRFDENFISPYQSTSIKDFWRRWHVSLSTWLRDYVYIPLGGNRVSNFLNFRNLLLVFIICGLWHGAELTFLLWGIYHGALLILEKTRFKVFLESTPRIIQRFYCLVLVTIGWVLFRAENLDHAMNYLASMFNFINPVDESLNFGLLNYAALIIGSLIALFGGRIGSLKNLEYRSSGRVWLINIAFFILSVCVLYTSNRNPFIYFNF